MNEPELIRNILAGNREAYKKIVDKYQSAVFRVCMGFVHNSEDANDISQEVFINAYLSLRKFRGKSSFLTWIYRITVNACLNHLRKNKNRGFHMRLEERDDNYSHHNNYSLRDYNPEPDKKLIDNQTAILVKKAIDELPEKQRTAFILSKYEELPQKEISKIMGASEGSVEQLLQRAKLKLRQKLKGI